jgi:ABC-type enterochelin transport system substrate-binding protein
VKVKGSKKGVVKYLDSYVNNMDKKKGWIFQPFYKDVLNYSPKPS